MPNCKKCGNVYQTKNVDDHYCSDECWEADNCLPPQEIEETMLVEEI